MNTTRMSMGDLVAARALDFGDGYRTKRREHGYPGYRILRVADVLEDVVKLDGPDFVSEKNARAIGSKVGQTGDILLTTKGTVGRVAVMPATDEPVVYSPQLCYFRVLDPSVVTPGFLRYWFRSNEFWAQASYRMNNTDMAAYINMADIRSLQMSLPPIAEQQAIAEVLGALDDKIAANTKLAEIADGLIRNEFGALQASSSESVRLSQLVEHRRQTVDPAGLETSLPYVGLEHIPRRSMWLQDCGTSADVSSAKSCFRSGDILFGKLRPYFHKVVTAPEAGICSTDVLVLAPKEDRFAGFALAGVSDDLVVQLATAASEGTRMPRTSWKDLSNVEIVWPGDVAAETFSNTVQSLRNHVIGCLAENKTLAETRDALLPQLMSGKLRVREAEALVEAAV